MECLARTCVAVVDANAGDDYSVSKRHLGRMKLKSKLFSCGAAFAVAFGIFSTLISHAGATPGISGTASVIDGDTLEIRGQRIRLHAIDAPESRQNCERGGKAWRCGQTAALALSDKIGRRPVRCEQVDTDRYGRIVAKCFVQNQDLGGWLVGQGLAVAYRQYGRDYSRAEREAKAARRGIWSGKFVMPWEWRKAAR